MEYYCSLCPDENPLCDTCSLNEANDVVCDTCAVGYYMDESSEC